MQVVFRSAAGEQELDVGVRDPEATLADLVRGVLGGPAPATVRVGGRDLPASTTLTDSGLHAACVVEAGTPPAPPGELATTPLELVVVAGPGCGRVLPVPLGRSVLGRGGPGPAVPSRTVSRSHARLDAGTAAVVVTDAGSANGSRLDGTPLTPGVPRTLETGGLLQVGAVLLRLRVAGADQDRPRGLDARRAAGAAGSVPFNRPPRPAPPAAPRAVSVPAAPTTSAAAAPLGVAGLLGGVATAALLVAVTGSLRYALVSAALPLLAVGTWYESRRRAAHGEGRGRRARAAALEALAGDAAGQAAVERARLLDLAPDLGEVLRRAAVPSVRLWERRPGDPDALRLQAGTADLAWSPPVAGGGPVPDDAAEVLAAVRLPAAPVVLDLSGGGVVGIVGDREAGLALARGLLVQACVGSGPADLTVAVLVDPGRQAAWSWTTWLPHTRGPGAPTERWLAASRTDADGLLRRLARGEGTRTVLLVLDSPSLTEGRSSPARDLLQTARSGAAGDVPVAGIVLAPTVDRLPASCTAVVDVHDGDGTATVTRTGETTGQPGVLTAGLEVTTARTAARDLARYEDPELGVAGADLPGEVRLLPLLGLDRVDAEAVLARWAAAGPDPGARAVVGVTAAGRFVLDLVRDGAHGLIGGTTGSGKSELLRSLVAALAVSAPPSALTFLLVDYKGGAAFDVCAGLPHTVGLVTDLDDRLGARALQALDAELHHRERTLRSVGADNLSDYLVRTHRTPGAAALPRLLVVVDEFATLAAELPDFVCSLVGVAQRGRTLGVHLLLATQRPSGAVSEDIRANTNLRVALRVQDPGDSTDVLGVPDAAAIPRDRPGRAWVRLGHGDVVAVQTALATCVTDATADLPVDVAPLLFGPSARAAATTVRAPTEGPTDLARLVDAVARAHARTGAPAPRRPWPAPLPAGLAPADVPDPGPLDPARPVARVGLVDDPRRQRRTPLEWHPHDGNLLVLGVPGSGTTTTLAAVGLALARALPPDRLALQVMDLGAGALDPLAALPHTGGVVRAGDRERQARLVRMLRAELDSRRARPRDEALARRTVLLLDGLPALRAELDDLDGAALLDELTRVWTEGPAVGLSVVATADRGTGVPAAWTAVTLQRWLHRLSDPYEYGTAGVAREDVPHPLPGRLVALPAGLHAQVVEPVADLTAAVAGVAALHPGAVRSAPPVAVLPSLLPRSTLPPARTGVEPWLLPLGLREQDLGAAVLRLYPGEHALVAGPARSGRSGVLALLAETLREAGVAVRAVGSPRSGLRGCGALDGWADSGPGLAAQVAGLRGTPGPGVLLVDDADAVEDVDGALAGLLAACPPELHVVAAGRSDALRTLYGHWTGTVRRSRAGVLLRPDVDLDGDLLGVLLPRRAPVRPAAGRGYLCQDGEAELLQVASTDRP